eukprot:s2250_g14.t1
MDRRDTPLAVEDVVLALRGASMVSQDASEDSYEDDRASTRTKSSRSAESFAPSIVAATILHPSAEDNNVRRIWTALVVFLLGYIGTVFLYRLIFIRFYAAASEEVQETDVWIAFDGMVDVMFIVDLWIQFLFTYTNERGKEAGVGSPRKIACRYLTGWFWVNMISCIPEDAASAFYAFFAGEESIEANNSQKTVRLMRMQRMTKIVVAVLNTLFGLIWVVHVMACGWYLCATLHEDVLETWLARRLVGINEDMLLHGDPFDQWAHAMYFIFSVFTTVGFGDISAFTTGEIMYVTLTMMVGAVVHSIIIGQVINEVNAFLKNKLKLAKEFAVHAQLDSSGSKALSFWLEQNIRDLMGQQKVKGVQQEGGPVAEERSTLPALQRSAYTQQVSSCPLCLFNATAAAHAALARVGDAASHLYLVLSGTFAFVARPERHSKSPKANDMWPYQLFSHASYFGNYELHTGTKQFRRSTARCETPQGGQVLRLQKDHYQRLCGDFPQFAAAWKYEANRRESHRCWLHANHTRMLTYRLLAVRRMQKLCRFYLRKADKTNKDEAVKADSSGLLVPGRNSLRSSCSSTAISEGMGSVSMCSVLHENRDSSAGRKPLLPPSTHLLSAGPEELDASPLFPLYCGSEDVLALEPCLSHVLGWGRGLLLVSFSSLWLRMSLLLSCYATLSWLLARWVHFLDSNRAEHVLLGSVQIAELRSCEKMVQLSILWLTGVSWCPKDEDARQRRLVADVAMLRSEVEIQGETLTALRREMARLPFLVAAALKGQSRDMGDVQRPLARQWALWILASALPSNGQGTTTVNSSSLTQYYSPDVPGQCITMKSCQLQGNFPNRGFCVSTVSMPADEEGPGSACYDVCNPKLACNAALTKAMVAQVRAGLNNNVTCPRELGLQDSMQKCPPGELCSDEIRHRFKINSGQGMCVDMCDMRHPPSRFAEGAHQGIALHVMEFRNSGACQAKPWLPWVISLLVLLLLGACCRPKQAILFAWHHGIPRPAQDPE